LDADKFLIYNIGIYAVDQSVIESLGIPHTPPH
jgi:hypothetical protein